MTVPATLLVHTWDKSTAEERRKWVGDCMESAARTLAEYVAMCEYSNYFPEELKNKVRREFLDKFC